MNEYLKRYKDQDTKTKVTYQSKIKDQDNIDVLMGRVVADDDVEMDYEPIFVETKESAFIDPAIKKQLIANLTRQRSRSQSDSDSDSSDSSDSDLKVQRQPRPQEIIFRDPKTGLRMTQEQKIEASKPIITDKQAIIEANKQRIQSWSKGIVQQQQRQEPQQVLSTEEHNRQVDLNLIKQFHFDDPMRQQIAEEDEQKITIDKHKFLLKCKFPSMPNRFNIQAGYRWDGVDRSNGYEQKFLEAVNEREDRHTRGRLENMKDL